MSLHQIKVFISHFWNYSEHYDKLSEWIFDIELNIEGIPIKFLDFSIPKEDPIHNASTSQELQQAIFNEIKKSHVVIIPTGMYVDYSKWIQKEIDGSKKFGRPILAVS